MLNALPLSNGKAATNGAEWKREDANEHTRIVLFTFAAHARAARIANGHHARHLTAARDDHGREVAAQYGYCCGETSNEQQVREAEHTKTIVSLPDGGVVGLVAKPSSS